RSPDAADEPALAGNAEHAGLHRGRAAAVTRPEEPGQPRPEHDGRDRRRVAARPGTLPVDVAETAARRDGSRPGQRQQTDDPREPGPRRDEGHRRRVVPAKGPGQVAEPESLGNPGGRRGPGAPGGSEEPEIPRAGHDAGDRPGDREAEEGAARIARREGV